MKEEIKQPKYKIGDIVCVQGDDPEKIIMATIFGAELTNNTKWFYSMTGFNLSTEEKQYKYEEDIINLTSMK